jgi:hypothetical protein
MKSILAASAVWLLIALFMAVLIGKLIKGVRRRDRPQLKALFSASTVNGGSEMERPANTDNPRGNTVLPLTRKEVRTISGPQSLIERYVSQLKELETRMADTKHKLDTVMEASRLLVEEGLSDEYPPDRSGEERTYQKDG